MARRMMIREDAALTKDLVRCLETFNLIQSWGAKPAHIVRQVCEGVKFELDSDLVRINLRPDVEYVCNRNLKVSLQQVGRSG